MGLVVSSRLRTKRDLAVVGRITMTPSLLRLGSARASLFEMKYEGGHHASLRSVGEEGVGEEEPFPFVSRLPDVGSKGGGFNDVVFCRFQGL